MNEAKTKEIKICIPEEIFSFFFPEETIDHILNAKKEVLLAFRSLIDAKIEALEKKVEKKDKKKEKIKIN